MAGFSQRYLIVCGGTGGHLSPGIAIAERLIARGHECRLVVSRKEIDSRLREKYTHLHFEAAPGAPLGFSPAVLARFLIQSVLAFRFAGELMRSFRPNAIVVFGGFMSPPYILLARKAGIFVAIHESNRLPGRAVRMLARQADRVYLPVGVRLRQVPVSRIRCAGYPVRREIKHIKKADARRKMELKGHGRTLVIIGGSQGARSLNQWVGQHFKELAREGINVFAVTGPGKGAASVVELRSEQGEAVRATFIPFSDDMGLLLSVADLVISRAGAGAIAEITECLAPAILIPYPHAADRHQEANARFLEKQGGAIVVMESEMDRLIGEVRDLIFNDWMLNQLRSNLRALTRGNVAEEMVRDLERSVGLHGERLRKQLKKAGI